MEPFTIQCTTCKARLVVKDESVIGDILACPKCNSMVQVVPPVGWQRAGHGAGAAEPAPSETPRPAQTPTSPAPAATAPEPVARKAVAVPPALPERAAALSVPAAVFDSEAAAADDAADHTVDASGDLAETAPAEPTAGRLAPLVARARRDWRLLGGGLAGGVALGAAVWLVVAMQAPRVDSADVGATAGAAGVAASPETPSAPPDTHADTPAKTAESTAEAPTASTTTSDNAAATTAEPKPAADPELASAGTAEPVAAPAPKPAGGLTPSATADAVPAPEPSLRLDPVTGGSGNTAGASIPAGIGSFLAPSPAVPASAGSAGADEPTDHRAAADAGDDPPALLPDEETGLSSAEVESRLSVSLAGVAFADVPLAQFATFVSDVAGVPVLIDDAALAKAGKDRRMGITIRLEQTTAAEALRAAVEAQGLTYTVGDGRIVISSARP